MLFGLQGLLQAWNFNQPEALRAFKLAAKADPSAAMAHWGQAYALGPGANRHSLSPCALICPLFAHGSEATNCAGPCSLRLADWLCYTSLQQRAHFQSSDVSITLVSGTWE